MVGEMVQNSGTLYTFTFTGSIDSHSPSIFSFTNKAVHIQDRQIHVDIQERFLPLLPGYKYFSNHVYLQFFLKFILVVVVASAFFTTSKTFLLVHSCHVFLSLLTHC